MRIALDIAAMIVAMALLVLAMFLDARSHDTPFGWSYPYECCSGYDCRPVNGPGNSHPESRVRIEMTSDGYVVSTTGQAIAISDPRIKPSPDGEYHWCSTGGSDDGRTICLFVPPLGF